MSSKNASENSRMTTVRRGVRIFHRVPCTLLLALALVLSLLTNVPATIINVPADQTTIQAGIDASSNGDTVLVAPGYYLENISFKGKDIVVSSHFLLDQDPAYIFSTIIDGSNPTNPDTTSTVAICCEGEQNPIFQGFNVTGGQSTYMYDAYEHLWFHLGGGIVTDSGSPVIQFNYIHDNGANDHGGGGIYMQFGTPTFCNNIVTDNLANAGCGVLVCHANSIIRNNVIFNNRGGSQWGGSGLYQYTGSMLCENNTIVYNTSTQGGGGLRVAVGAATVRNTIIYDNLAPQGPQVFLVNGGTVNASYCNIKGGWTGEGNIDVAPGFAGERLLLQEGSLCVDAGNADAAFNDPAWPGAPSEARWPSLGGLRNDIGAYGGPGCYPWDLAPIQVDNNFGWTPLEVSFEAESYFEADSWSWHFGDGDSTTGQTAVHTYEEPGLYDVTLTIGHDAGQTYVRTLEALVYALADTMWADDAACSTSTGTVPMEIVIQAHNSVPLDDILIPVAYSGDLGLVYQGFTTDGCRTVDFDSQVEISHDSAAGTAVIELSGESVLAPGNGPILKLLFNAIAPHSGQTATIALTSGLIVQDPKFAYGTVDFQPATIDGSVTTITSSCCVGDVGDVDMSGGVDITDISILVDNQFLTLTPLVCEEEGNINYPGSGYPVTDMVVDISDLSYLIDNQFLTLAPLPPCP